MRAVCKVIAIQRDRAISTCHPQITAAMAAYGTKPRTEWVCDWPAMVVLAVAQVFWSAGVEGAVAEGAVPAFLAKCADELMGLTDLVGASAVAALDKASAQLGMQWSQGAYVDEGCWGADSCLPSFHIPPGARPVERKPAADAGGAHHD